MHLLGEWETYVLDRAQGDLLRDGVELRVEAVTLQRRWDCSSSDGDAAMVVGKS
jgi:hypothetical protein